MEENYFDLEPLFPLELLPDDTLEPVLEVPPFLESSLLYPKDKNLEYLKASDPLCPFYWCNYKQNYTNLYLDPATNLLVLHPLMPHQLLSHPTFENFMKESQNKIILVARLGFEIHFGTADNFKDIEKKIISWFNHHIYDTTVIVDIHDFCPNSNERRVSTYNAMLVPKQKNKEKACVYWKKGQLHHLQSV